MNGWEALVSIVLIVAAVLMVNGWPWRNGGDDDV